MGTHSVELGATQPAATLAPRALERPSLGTDTERTDGGEPGDGRGGGNIMLAVGHRLGRYTLLEPLGRGGMGVVFTAYDEELDRKVAIKFLLDTTADADTRAALLREAQAMARLAHPNVIHVYEVGETLERRVFIAMEFVRGQSLRAWLQAPRAWPEVVAMFVQAGRGLAAAHQAGLVHCDFKPDNVLVGPDGRARVLDFGLARRQEHTPTAGDGRSAGPRGGTPIYMSPEQLGAGEVDARSDQFSFCVALYEALHGHRPFAGATMFAILGQIVAGAIEPAPGEARLPARLRRALRIGLAPEPAARHPSMTALLAELAESLPRPRGAWPAVALVSAALASTASWLLLRDDDPAAACAATVAAEIDPVWSEGPRATVERAFAATGLPYAADSFARTARLLDQRADEWSRLRQSACELARGAPSPGAADRLRARCLERRRLALAAWVDTLTRADAAVVEQAVAATAELPEAQPCADPSTLLGEVEGAVDLAREAEAAGVEGLLAQARAHALAGQHARGVAPVEEARRRARRLGHARLEADALLQLGLLQEHVADGDQAADTLSAAYFTAESAHHHATRAEAAVHLVYVTGAQSPRLAEGALWARHAAAIAAGLGEGGAELRQKLLQHRSSAAIVRRQYGEARRDLEAALALATERLGPDHPALAHIFQDLAEVAQAEGRPDEALAYNRRALTTTEANLGPDHPSVALLLTGRGKVHERQGHLDVALRDYRAALAIWERAYGPDHTRLVWALTCIGRALVKSGDLAAAEPYYARALKLVESHLGPDHLQVGHALIELATVVRGLGRGHDARRMLERAAGIIAADVGERHPLGLALIELGEAALADGDWARAVPLLERARAAQSPATNSPDELARTDIALARALWAADRDRPRALELADRAVRTYRSVGESHAPARTAAEAWLAARRP